MVSISSNGGGATASFSLGENQSLATTVAATGGGAITYSISGGLDALLFAIDAQTGVLSFLSAPNFEAAGDSGADNVYDVEVTASDGTLSASQALAITVTNVNEAPVFTISTSLAALENGYNVALLTATDPDGDPITFSRPSGEDYFKLNVTPSTGQLSFTTAPNFEAPHDVGQDGTYNIDIRVSDGTLFTTQTFSVTVGNVNEGAMISSNGGGATAAFTVAENQLVATTVVGRDNPVGTSIGYAITGGNDSSRFTINAQTGVLSFVSAPNFESPHDFELQQRLRRHRLGERRDRHRHPDARHHRRQRQRALHYNQQHDLAVRAQLSQLPRFDRRPGFRQSHLHHRRRRRRLEVQDR